jgi:hypothetical protein
MLRVQVLLLIIVLAVASGTAWALQNSIKLMLDGKVISTEVQIFKGRAYVPLNDLAKVLDVTVVKQDGHYNLTRSGGADPLHASADKMAPNSLPKAWQFQVTSVQQVAEYSPQYGSEKDLLTPKETGDVLVVIKCWIKNNTQAMQEVSFDRTSTGNTALTDDQEHGYVPLAYDSRDSGYSSDKVPSGSVHDFVVIFSVPKGTNLKDLVYTVGGSEMETSTDFRVSLKS